MVQLVNFTERHKSTRMLYISKNFASAGNRTRAARVAGEHSTTEPPMPLVTLSIYMAHFYDIGPHLLSSYANPIKCFGSNTCLKAALQWRSPLPKKNLSHAGNRTPAAAVKAPNPNQLDYTGTRLATPELSI